MAAQKGRDLLLKIRDDATVFQTVAGIRARRLAFDAEAIDVTHVESTGRWRELLAGGGLKRASVVGSGIFRDAASDLLIRQTFFAGAIRNWQVIVPDFARIEGQFQIVTLTYRGDHDGEVLFDMALESAGALAVTAL
jgi:TP901-1 family phage major tail protein